MERKGPDRIPRHYSLSRMFWRGAYKRAVIIGENQRGYQKVLTFRFQDMPRFRA
jgi:hypothetical protein